MVLLACSYRFAKDVSTMIDMLGTSKLPQPLDFSRIAKVEEANCRSIMLAGC
jgi:hypothetical protein